MNPKLDTMTYPTSLNQSLLKSENSPLKNLSLNSILKLIKKISKALLKNETIVTARLTCLVSFDTEDILVLLIAAMIT